MSGKTWRDERDVAEAAQDDTIQEKGQCQSRGNLEKSTDICLNNKLSTMIVCHECSFGED